MRTDNSLESVATHAYFDVHLLPIKKSNGLALLMFSKVICLLLLTSFHNVIQRFSFHWTLRASFSTHLQFYILYLCLRFKFFASLFLLLSSNWGGNYMTLYVTTPCSTNDHPTHINNPLKIKWSLSLMTS